MNSRYVSKLVRQFFDACYGPAAIILKMLEMVHRPVSDLVLRKLTQVLLLCARLQHDHEKGIASSMSCMCAVHAVSAVRVVHVREKIVEVYNPRLTNT